MRIVQVSVSFWTLAGAFLLATSPASAADLAAAEEAPSLFDVAFGVKLTSDYTDRGYTNSAGGPAVQGYVELSAFDWVYAGVWGSSVSYPTSRDLTDPAAEIDYYGGFRHTWDSFTLDVGGLYYDYPKETLPFPGAKEIDYWELTAKPSYEFGDFGSITGFVAWTSDYANTGSNSTFILGTAKVNVPVASLPDFGFYVSAELGYQWLGKSEADFNPKNYLTWSAGGGFTYKAMTIDLRYTGADLTRSQCFGVSGARSWCGDRFMASVAFDTTLSALK